MTLVLVLVVIMAAVAFSLVAVSCVITIILRLIRQITHCLWVQGPVL